LSIELVVLISIICEIMTNDFIHLDNDQNLVVVWFNLVHGSIKLWSPYIRSKEWLGLSKEWLFLSRERDQITVALFRECHWIAIALVHGPIAPIQEWPLIIQEWLPWSIVTIPILKMQSNCGFPYPTNNQPCLKYTSELQSLLVRDWSPLLKNNNSCLRATILILKLIALIHNL
jgi:hypothetical protein